MRYLYITKYSLKYTKDIGLWSVPKREGEPSESTSDRG